MEEGETIPQAGVVGMGDGTEGTVRSCTLDLVWRRGKPGGAVRRAESPAGGAAVGLGRGWWAGPEATPWV